jgi:hypothetical protein
MAPGRVKEPVSGQVPAGPALVRVRESVPVRALGQEQARVPERAPAPEPQWFRRALRNA